MSTINKDDKILRRDLHKNAQNPHEANFTLQGEKTRLQQMKSSSNFTMDMEAIKGS